MHRVFHPRPLLCHLWLLPSSGTAAAAPPATVSATNASRRSPAHSASPVPGAGLASSTAALTAAFTPAFLASPFVAAAIVSVTILTATAVVTSFSSAV